ncbi:MAG: ABC transporter ATP-binding protein [Candidatus Babeliales bacterium]
MKSIRLENIKKSYNGQEILDGINLTIPSGQFFALLGPSGCGKTTILRLIAGFETADSGAIYLGDENITHVPINERNINTVFQNYALFPHLNVFDNVAYSQRIRGVPEEIIEKKVIKILHSVHLDAHIYKSIGQLSGGQKQRVALARAIINEPDVLLLDEPLTALDPKLREKLLLELIDLQTNLKTTFVYVTHDHFEALTVADHMAIMNQDGFIEQIGTPKEIYEFPVSTFVAKFVGSANLLKGHVVNFENKHVKVAVESLGSIDVFTPENKPWIALQKEVFISIRPEKILISKVLVEGFSNKLTGTVESIVYHGRSTQYNVRLVNDLLISVFEQNEEHFPKEIIDYGDTVNLYWQKENAVLLKQ